MIPVLIGVLLSYAISSSLAMSIFDVLLDMKNLPYLPALKSEDQYSMTAKEIMNNSFLYLTQESTFHDITTVI